MTVLIPLIVAVASGLAFVAYKHPGAYRVMFMFVFPVLMMGAALFFATLSQGGLAIHAFVPKQMVEVLQGVVIIAVAMSVPEVRRALRQARRPASA